MSWKSKSEHDPRLFNVKICRLYISPGHNYFGHHGLPPGEHPVVEVSQIECVAGKGIEGDRFFGFKENYKGQITFLASEIFETVCRQFGVLNKSPGVMRRNVVTAGVDLNRLIGKRFTAQEVEFEGVCECSPCYWMDGAIAPGAEEALRGNGGLRAKILTDGTLRVDA